MYVSLLALFFFQLFAIINDISRATFINTRATFKQNHNINEDFLDEIQRKSFNINERNTRASHILIN